MREIPALQTQTVLASAQQEGRIVVTEDKDFGELIVVRRRPHSGIIRFLELPIAEQAVAMQEVLTYYEADLMCRGQHRLVRSAGISLTHETDVVAKARQE